MANPKAKFQPWKVIVNGAAKFISVLSTDTVDLSVPVGAAGPFDFYNNSVAYYPGQVVIVDSTTVYGGVTLTPGIYGCRLATDKSAVGNQVPQWPMPSQRSQVYWVLIAFSPKVVNICQSGTKRIGINATDGF